jgi:amino acid transporter
MSALHNLRESFERTLIGNRLQTKEISHQTASNPIALAVLASDALSSVSYATEEILIILNTGAIAGFALFGFTGNAISIPLALAISVLIIIVTISYRQTIFSNPAGGGGYRVAKENLGEEMAQITGASLMLDYILVVAVSISAGVANLISVVPAIAPYRVPITVGVIVLMTVVNLRGVKESARLFAVPTYFFLVTIFIALIVGFIRMATGTLGTVTGVEPIHHDFLEPITVLLLLRAFSSGCTALTGIEAISMVRANNAAKTLVTMSIILITLFLSITVLANAIQAVPSHEETVISQVARTIYGEEGAGGLAYVLTMAGAFAVLFMAANTAFADFPQLAALASADGFLPRQLTYRGRRLVFSWGIATLSGSAILIVIVTGAIVTNIIPLYAIGVFLGFSISQAGMVRRFWRAGHVAKDEFVWGLETKIFYDPQWKVKIAISAVGAVITFIVMVVFIITKFTAGAWFICILIPVLVWVFFRIHRHYKEVAAKLKLIDVPIFSHKAVDFDPEVHKELAVYFCDTWSMLSVRVMEAILKRGLPFVVIHSDVNPKATEKFRQRSKEIIDANGWDPDMVQVIEEPYRDLFKSVHNTLTALTNRYPDVYLEVYIGALRLKPPYNLLHMATDRFLRDALEDLENVSLNIKHLNLDKIPLPPGFKVTFEHSGHAHHEDEHGHPHDSGEAGHAGPVNAEEAPQPPAAPAP